MRKGNDKGFTFVELTVVILMAGLLILALAKFMRPAVTFFARTPIRQATLQDAQSCLDTITTLLQMGSPSSAIIKNSAGSPNPFTEIDFVKTDGSTAYRIYQQDDKVWLVTTTPPVVGTASTPKLMASNVAALTFAGDTGDPSVVLVGLNMSAPLDHSNLADHQYNVTLAQREVHMNETP